MSNTQQTYLVAPCTVATTRAALLALRASASLNKDCNYVITDFVQGRLVAGTLIYLSAISPTAFSENVSVLSTYDNEAWRGIYNIDTNLVIELQDNRNNIVRASGGGAVSNFDWGNANYTNVLVDNAVLTVTYGSPIVLSNVRLSRNAALNMTGMLGGNLQLVTVDTQAQLILTNSNVVLFNWTITEDSYVTFAGYTSGNTLRNVQAELGAQIYSDNATAFLSMTNVTVSKNGRVLRTGATSSMSFNRVSITDFSYVQQTAAAGSVSLSDTTIAGGSNIASLSAGTLTTTNVKVNGASSIYKDSGTGNLTVSNSQVNSAGWIRNRGSATTIVSSTVVDGAVIDNIVGSAASMTVVQSRVESGANIQNAAAATAGTLTVSACNVTTGSTIIKSSTGGLSVQDCTLSNRSNTQLAGAANLSLLRVDARNQAQITSTCSTAGSGDSLSDSSVLARGVVSFSGTRTATNSLSWCMVEGVGGAINILGTTSAQSIGRMKALDGVISFNNQVTAVSASFLLAMNGGNISFTSNTSARTCSQLSAVDGGVINFSNLTAAGSHNRCTVSSGGNLTVNSVAGNGLDIDVSARGTIIHNGGSLTAMSKTMSSTLTTGAFNHTNIAHHTATNKVLTGANTNRADYMGLAAQLV